ncbi:MAG TPA: Rrf2 family transcriptional regulator [Clostridia bacterium]|nr:Rrf2 family transcriptional regulator [Clostridia bacterium]
MLITKETDYALRILRALAHGEQRTTAQLSQSEQIPHQFAYKILKKLQKGGMVRILRGADGGCILALGLDQITLYQLIQVMEQDTAVSVCMLPGHLCQWRQAHGNTVCHTHLYLTSVQKKLNQELAMHSLQKVLFGD